MVSNERRLTVLDGPVHSVRHRRSLPGIAYAESHRRRIQSPPAHWVRVPELPAGERSRFFPIEEALSDRYLRVG